MTNAADGHDAATDQLRRRPRIRQVPAQDLLRPQPADGTNVLRADGLHELPGADPGVLHKPSFIFWHRSAAGGAEPIVAQMGKSHRRQVRRMGEQFAALRMSVQEPITPQLYEEWEALYRQNMGQLAGGANLARLARSEICRANSHHLMLSWWDQHRLIAGAIGQIDAERSCLAVRFSASVPTMDPRPHRWVYLRLADLTAARGLRTFSLGTDPNFYGGAVSAALCRFKLDFAMQPDPAQLWGVGSSIDVTEQLISRVGLREPLATFEYAASDRLAADPSGDSTMPRLRLVLIGEEDQGHLFRFPSRRIDPPVEP